MSYILEALKKAEQQRELGQVPGIASDHDGAKTPISRRWLWIPLLVVNAVILVLLALLWARTDSSTVRVVDSGSIVQPVPVIPPPEPRVTRTQPALAPVIAEPVLAPVVSGNHGQSDEAEVEEWAGAESADSLEPLPLEPAPAAELPVWPRIPDHLLSQLASGLRLDVHVYSERAEDRFVLINLAKYQEGDTVRDGPVLQEITPRGAILSLQGQSFLLPAQ